MIRWLLGACGYTLAMTIVAACVVGDRPAVANLECTDGNCVCGAGFGNCDANPNNGCETVLSVNPKHCGSCGTVCVNGTCEDGSCACSDGFFDCNVDGADGCEALIRADPDNCGSCGRSCLGGDCSASRCAPFLLAELGTYIYALASNVSDVFYCDATSGVIYRVPKATGEVIQLAFDQNCYALAASQNHLFWSVIENGEELVRIISADGGTPKTIAVADRIEGFAAIGETAVWSEYDDVGLVYNLFAGTAVGVKTSVAQSPEIIREVVVSGNRVYWVEGATSAESNIIQTAPITGGISAPLVTTDMVVVRQIILVDDMVYWVQTDSEGADPMILRIRSTGGEAEELYARNRQIDHLLGDATGLYWTEDQGDRWLTGPLAGGDVQVLAEFQDITLPALGTDSLYWIDFPSHLFALAK